MPYSIKTKDGITINNIPDDIAPDSDVLKSRVAEIRSQNQRPADSESGIYKRLSPETIKQIETKVPERSQKTIPSMWPSVPAVHGALKESTQRDRNRLANLERIRIDNPILAKMIEEMSGGEAALIGAGKKFEDFGEGIGRILGILDAEDALDEPGYIALKSARAAPGIGEGIAEAGMMAVPATKLAKSPAALAAAEGVISGLTKGGEGADVGDITKSAATTAALTFAGGKLFNYGKLTPKQAKIKTALETNPRDPELAKFLIVNGRPEATKSLQAAAKQFGQEGDSVVAVIKNASKADKSAIKKMVNTVKQGKKDPLFKDVNRVGEVVGDGLKKRVLMLRRINSDAGKRIDNVARTQLKGKKVDLTKSVNEFKSAMDDLRVKYDPVSGEVGFTGSALEGAGAGSSRDLIKRLAVRLKKTDMDAADAHFMKRLIDKEVTFGKSPGGMAGDIDDSIKGLRANINDSIRDISPSYKKANLKYKDTIEAIDNLQTAAGRTLDLDSAQALGVAARRLTNNTQSRAKLLDSLAEIDAVTQRYGVKFKDDILTQTHIANALENRFKTQGTTSLEGIGQRVASGLTKSKLQLGIDAAGQAIDKVSGVSDEKALNALLKILEQ